MSSLFSEIRLHHFCSITIVHVLWYYLGQELLLMFVIILCM